MKRSDDRDSTRFPYAPARTLFDPDAAPWLKRMAKGPWRCAEWNGERWCGPTARAKLTLRPCEPVETDVIITKLPRDLKARAILGRDVLDTCKVPLKRILSTAARRGDLSGPTLVRMRCRAR